MEGDDKALAPRNSAAVDSGSIPTQSKNTLQGSRRTGRALQRAKTWLFNKGPTRLVLGVGLVGTMYAAYRLPAGFFDRNWLHFDILRRCLLWLVRSTAFRSLVGPLLLLASYFFTYWLFIRKRRYIVISEVRVWGALEKDFPPKGVAARLRDSLMSLQDELMKLWSEMRLPEREKPTKHASQGASPILFEDEGLSLPETEVTLQYEGFSVEALSTFVRRFTKRELVITADVSKFRSDSLLLVGRGADDGPWRVAVAGLDSAALDLGLRRLAVRILSGFAERHLSKEANAFVLLQTKAREIEDYDQAFHLAQLGWGAAPDTEIAKWNLATAYNDCGIGFGEKDEYPEAILNFAKAIEYNAKFEEAYRNLARAYEAVGDEENRAAALKNADEIRAERSNDSIT